MSFLKLHNYNCIKDICGGVLSIEEGDQMPVVPSVVVESRYCVFTAFRVFLKLGRL